MPEVCRKLTENMAQARTHFVLDVICRDTGLFVVLPDGTHLARLNMHLTDALGEEVRLQAVRLEALINKKNIFE